MCIRDSSEPAVGAVVDEGEAAPAEEPLADGDTTESEPSDEGS